MFYQSCHLYIFTKIYKIVPFLLTEALQNLIGLTLYGGSGRYRPLLFRAPYRLYNIFYEDSIDIYIQPIYISVKCRKFEIFIFFSFCAVSIGPKNIKVFFLVLKKKFLIGNPILFFLNNFKSTATMVPPKFRFILLKLQNKIMFGN